MKTVGPDCRPVLFVGALVALMVTGGPLAAQQATTCSGIGQFSMRACESMAKAGVCRSTVQAAVNSCLQTGTYVAPSTGKSFPNLERR